jgi:hypothetical protein
MAQEQHRCVLGRGGEGSCEVGLPDVSLWKLRRMVTHINAESPDLVALLGDYVDPRVTGATEVPIATAHVARLPPQRPVCGRGHPHQR